MLITRSLYLQVKAGEGKKNEGEQQYTPMQVRETLRVLDEFDVGANGGYISDYHIDVIRENIQYFPTELLLSKLVNGALRGNCAKNVLYARESMLVLRKVSLNCGIDFRQLLISSGIMETSFLQCEGVKDGGTQCSKNRRVGSCVCENHIKQAVGIMTKCNVNQ